ncbi:endo-1,4-beta-xylanase [Rhodoblastus acidophilus]|uniref:endo-1,4-beta-xylanase n=1 Tax=Rhodoblastus acidophilus TaxID=1074 RepID=UPI002223FC06|nr:endo-1,4-beta-xylanase [Rhodoblastus acidophilus]MCW2317519.1 endo-1,4-beta-xylanase [Rhodoblastus acidophilus]
MTLSRRRFGACALGGLAAAAASSSQADDRCRDSETAPPYHSSVGWPLGENGVLWGAHLEGETVYDSAVIAALAKEKPKTLVIGSGLKFDNLHPLSIACRREYDGKFYSTWAEPDDMAALADRLGADLRGDALIWNDWLPSWITDLARDRPRNWREQLQGAFEQHLRDVFGHFKGREGAKLRWCGLVNEPFEAWSLEAGNAPWRQGAWFDAFDPGPKGTPGYIHKAFEIAASCAGETALFLNEANCENDRFGPKLRPALLALVAELKQAGRRIDAVGLESHLMPQWMANPLRPDWRPFRKFLDDLAALDVKIYITELDVLDCAASGVAARDQLVADYFRSFVAAALEQPATVMVTNWDFSDNYSWLREDLANLAEWTQCGRKLACPRPTPYDQALAPKLARDALGRSLAVRRN